jgi:sigma-E factor negative regulatory protein RseA
MKDKISQLMDGELDQRTGAEALEALRRDGAALEVWCTYHLISDAMRDTPVFSDGFSARFAERLSAEPTVLAPAAAAPRPRLLWAVAASLAAVGLVGWLAFGPQPQTGGQLAQGTAQPPKAPPAVRLTTLPKAANDYLLAHQGFSPRVYLQGMAPYVRTVSEPMDEPAK